VPNDDFVSKFIEYTKEYESPTSFWKWSAYATIAATLRYNVYYPHGLGKVYPNIYVILLADSAEYRKDAGLKLSSELLRELANTKVIEGRASFQAISEALMQDLPNRQRGTALKGGACIILAPEIASFFVNDPQLIPVLTDWYDYREESPINLKGNTGPVVIKNRCINILAASNETFLKEVYDDRATYGGLLRRTFMIKPDQTRPPNSLMYVDLSKYDTKPLILLLEAIAALKGEVTRTDEAAQAYDKWYKDLYAKYKTHPDRTGVLQSMHTSALKLAIIIAAAKGTLEITKEIILDAIEDVTSLKANYEAYAMGIGKSDQSRIGARILNMLWKVKDNRMTRQEILLQVWADISAEEFFRKGIF